MSTGVDEEVLVIPSRYLESAGSFLGFSSEVDRYLPQLLHPERLTYLSRSQAEEDPSFKQLVPYAILRFEDQVFWYTRGRSGGERRLHTKRSIGVGGHVERADGPASESAYRTGFLRELEEEVAIDSPWEERIVGLVHDDRTPVGAVHLGVVHEVRLARPAVTHREHALVDAGFVPLANVAEQREWLESWSAFVLDWLLSENDCAKDAS